LARSRILIAVSTPWASEKLCRTIQDLAERLDATVVVAHVAQATEEDESDGDVKARGEQTLAGLTGKLIDGGINAEGVLLFGDDIARAIINAADAHTASLIIVGASGKGRMARLLAGDVPQQVVRQSDRPVVIFPPDWSGTI